MNNVIFTKDVLEECKKSYNQGSIDALKSYLETINKMINEYGLTCKQKGIRKW